MANRKFHLFIRRSHRYLGVILGIQFLLWTMGGLYFSWSDIDEIHGDFERKHPPLLSGTISMISPSGALQINSIKPDSLHGVQVVNILQRPFYSIRYILNNRETTILADAQTGQVREDIGKDEAIAVAKENFIQNTSVRNVEYIQEVSKHSEYRGRPLPAWKITFDHYSNTNVYVSSQLGRVETFRNKKWRTFDLLWMFHTMDYSGRDNINNWVLRAFSIFGFVTILSGFVLFFVSSGLFNRTKRPKGGF